MVGIGILNGTQFLVRIGFSMEPNSWRESVYFNGTQFLIRIHFLNGRNSIWIRSEIHKFCDFCIKLLPGMGFMSNMDNLGGMSFMSRIDYSDEMGFMCIIDYLGEMGFMSKNH